MTTLNTILNTATYNGHMTKSEGFNKYRHLEETCHMCHATRLICHMTTSYGNVTSDNETEIRICSFTK